LDVYTFFFFPVFLIVLHCCCYLFLLVLIFLSPFVRCRFRVFIPVRDGLRLANSFETETRLVIQDRRLDRRAFDVEGEM